jgi:Tol biopolymer transport system component
MTDDRTLERAARSWIEAGPVRAPEHAVDAALLRIQTTPQERGLRAPWRLTTMPTLARIAAAAAIGVLLLGGAFVFFGRPNESTVGPPSTSAPTAPPSAAIPSEPPLGLAVVDLDGTVREELGMPRDGWYADLSTDGRLAFLTRSEDLGFCGQCGRAWRIAIVDTASSESGYVLGPNVDGARDLAWSPDGTRLAFSNDDGTGNIDIYVVDVGQQTEVVNAAVTRLTTDPAIDEFPAWTPDGTSIVYDNIGATGPDESGFSPTQEIWQVTVDGGDPVRLTTNDVWDGMPDVSPDGQVVFARESEMWTMNLDGTDQQKRNFTPGFNPRWSPDGSKLAILEGDPSERAVLPVDLGRGTDGPLLRVLVVDVATGGISNTGQRVVSDLNPAAWTPDGTALLINRYDDDGG